MKLSGEATLHAGIDEVYAALNDAGVLVRTIPGCQRLEQVGPDSYKATILAGVASIKGAFDGEVRLTDQDAPHSFTLNASGAGTPGTVAAVAKVALRANGDGTTHLAYDADATIGGVIAGVGQRMISGVARKTAGEFFAAVDRELATVTVVAPGAAASAPPVAIAVSPPLVGVAAVTPGEEPTHVWTAPPAAVDPSRQRIRELVLAATFGAVIALLGVIVGAIVAGW